MRALKVNTGTLISREERLQNHEGLPPMMAGSLDGLPSSSHKTRENQLPVETDAIGAPDT